MPRAETTSRAMPDRRLPAEHEIKLLVPPLGEARVAELLRRLCRPAPDHPEGRVGSLYFDTPELHLLGEKLASDYRKTKARLRWYPSGDGASPDPCFVELKRRRGTLRSKVRRAVQLPAATALRLGGDRRALRALLESAAASLGEPLVPGRYFPVVSFVYRRRRFVEPASGWRVNLDGECLVLGVDPGRVASSPGRRPGWSVVELKGPVPRVPARLAPLAALGCRRASFSKYAAVCRPA